MYRPSCKLHVSKTVCCLLDMGFSTDAPTNVPTCTGTFSPTGRPSWTASGMSGWPGPEHSWTSFSNSASTSSSGGALGNSDATSGGGHVSNGAIAGIVVGSGKSNCYINRAERA